MRKANTDVVKRKRMRKTFTCRGNGWCTNAASITLTRYHNNESRTHDIGSDSDVIYVKREIKRTLTT